MGNHDVVIAEADAFIRNALDFVNGNISYLNSSAGRSAAERRARCNFGMVENYRREVFGRGTDVLDLIKTNDAKIASDLADKLKRLQKSSSKVDDIERRELKKAANVATRSSSINSAASAGRDVSGEARAVLEEVSSALDEMFGSMRSGLSEANDRIAAADKFIASASELKKEVHAAVAVQNRLTQFLSALLEFYALYDSISLPEERDAIRIFQVYSLKFRDLALEYERVIGSSK